MTTPGAQPLRTRCQVTTGFFVLGRCGRPAGTICTGCGRAACDQHTLAGQQGPVCPECRPGIERADESVSDATWAARYRRRYREGARRRFDDDGIAWSYSSYDRHWFDSGSSQGPDADDWDDDSVFDS